jgi:holliday junction resolvase Hjr
MVKTKNKGTTAERELLHKFWQNNWGCIRISGSGSVPLPVPDLLAGNKKRWLAIECKSIAGKSKFLYPDDIDQITKFSNVFGAEPWLGMRFDRKGWFFLRADKLSQTKSGNYNVTWNICQEKGISFDQLVTLK